MFDNYYNINIKKTKARKCKWVNFRRISYGAVQLQLTSMKVPIIWMEKACLFRM